MFSVRYECGGRLGNCVFPYILCVLYQKEYGHIYTTTPQSDEIHIDDKTFLDYFWNPEQGGDVRLPQISANVVFRGYFQHHVLFRQFGKVIRDFLAEYPNQDIHTGCKEHYSSSILIEDYLPDKILDDSTLVIHLRMEDKVAEVIEQNSALFVIHPDDYEPVIKAIPHSQIIWIMNKPKQDIEFKYLAYLQKKYGGTYKPQNIEEDMTLMRKAKKLICSRSSLSWICSAFSTEQQIVAIPEKYENWSHETFQPLHPQTLLYSYRKASKKDLENIC